MPQPSYQSADGYIGETFFTIFFDTDLDAAHPPGTSAFEVQLNGTDVTVTNVAVDSGAKTVTVSISGFLLAGDIIDFVYTDPSGGDDVNAVQGTDGADAGSFAHSIIVFMGRPPTCFLRGTRILASCGERAVEDLRAGDLVVTRFGGLRPIRWIGTQSFHPRFANQANTPIRIKASSLGRGCPYADLHVSPGHAILVGDALAHAGALVDNVSITQPRRTAVIDYFHLDLGPHDCVLANGAWAESYFEDHNRNSFHNAADFRARFPGHAPQRQATCLPIVTAAHPQIAAIRARIGQAGQPWRRVA